MKIAQMSDLHFCAKNLKEANNTFGFAVNAAIENMVDAAIITGDSTDHALDGHSPALLDLMGHLKRLANHCPVMMLQGTFSHEPVGLLNMFSMIGAKYPIFIVDKIGAYGLSQNGWENFRNDQLYKVVVSAFPTVNKAELAATLGDKAGEVMGDFLYKIMSRFAPMNESLRADGVPSLLIGHGTVNDCISEHGVPMSGTDHEFGLGALYSARTDACALGHIHKHQKWEREFDDLFQTIAYAGSIGRFHYGEQGDKGFLIWNMVPGATHFDFIKTPSRVTIDLNYAGVPDLDEIKRIVSENPDAYVRLRYSIDEEHKTSVDRKAIEAILANCAGSQVQGFTQFIERQRAEGIGQELSFHGKLAKWVEATKDEHDANLDLLSQKLTLAETFDAEQIVNKIMGEINDVETIKENVDLHPRIDVHSTRDDLQITSSSSSSRDWTEPVPGQDSFFA